MLNNVKLENVLFLDIETVPQFESFDSLPDDSASLWDKKSSFFRKEDEGAGDVYQRAGIYAEFGKIVCISVGNLYTSNGTMKIRLKSYFGDDEKKLLVDFSDMLSKFCSQRNVELCAHNGKEFDFPYIARRMLINGLPLPSILDIAGKKPWEVSFLDTLELWKFGDYKNYTSLNLLTHVFNIPTPKDDIDGSMVAEVYYADKNLKRIMEYCEKDVVAIVQLLLRYKGLELINPENIESVSEA